MVSSMSAMPTCGDAQHQHHCFDTAHDHILVYTRGRCGSTSLQQALRRALGTRMPYVAEGTQKFPRAAKIHTPAVATAFVRQVPAGAMLWLVVLVRNPFDRACSMFFQNLPRYAHGLAHGAMSNHTMPLLTTAFGAAAPELTKGILDTLPAVVGRPLALPTFDPATRDAWLATSNLRLLVLRTEDSASWAQSVGARMGLRLPRADSRHNEGVKKWGAAVASLYTAFTASYAFERELVRRTLASTDLRFLYTEDERQVMAKRALHPAKRSAGYTNVGE